MGLIDTHAHLTFPELASQVEAVLERCGQAGVEHVITVGTDLDDARNAVALAERFADRVSAAVGFHPHEADRVSDEDIATMAQLWMHPRVVAMGEMGLDYHYDLADRAKQRKVFAGQLREAANVDKPVVIHCREAVDDAIAVLVEHGFSGRRVVFHCFTGTAEEAARLAGHGWRISFTGIVTFPKSNELQDIARAYPGDQLMVETDAPYLSPVPVRGKRPNEPAHVAHTARFLADLRGEVFEELAARTTENARQFFRL
jgi:TatD DNase family protein